MNINISSDSNRFSYFTFDLLPELDKVDSVSRFQVAAEVRPGAVVGQDLGEALGQPRGRLEDLPVELGAGEGLDGLLVQALERQRDLPLDGGRVGRRRVAPVEFRLDGGGGDDGGGEVVLAAADAHPLQHVGQLRHGGKFSYMFF